MDDRIVVVGSINADLMAKVLRHPKPGETVHGTGGQMLPGGKGANQAVAAARLGASVTMVGAVGADAAAHTALSGLRDSGVDLTRVARTESATGLAMVTVDQGGENSIVVVSGANGTVGADRVNTAADVIHSAAVVVCQGEIPADGVEALPTLITGRFLHNPAPVLPLTAQVLLASDPLVVNEHEAELVLDQLGGTQSEAISTPELLVEALRATGIASVVLTLGAKGSVVSDDDGTHSVPPAPVRAVDTTGAGDAFIGALALGLARGDKLLESARLASRVGAFAATGVGAQPSYPNISDELPMLGDAE
ncbi:MAG: ribokinase [Kocuria sp.]|nr:ribokinase [Kocuria sp.]MDO5617899.1 ribokinase [Kocuria sp.]